MAGEMRRTSTMTSRPAASRDVTSLCAVALAVAAAASLLGNLPPTVEGHRGGGHESHQHHQSSRHRPRQSAPSAGGDAAAAAGGVQGAGAGGFHDSRIVHDTEHINEHLQGKAAVNLTEMSVEELEFYYFKMHDFDNNTKLDGLEILKALTHLLPYEDLDDEEKSKVDTKGKTAEEVEREKREKELEYYTDIVDNVLEEDDIDNDGYLTYPEYILSRRREEARELHEEAEHRKIEESSTNKS